MKSVCVRTIAIKRARSARSIRAHAKTGRRPRAAAAMKMARRYALQMGVTRVLCTPWVSARRRAPRGRACAPKTPARLPKIAQTRKRSGAASATPAISGTMRQTSSAKRKPVLRGSGPVATTRYASRTRARATKGRRPRARPAPQTAPHSAWHHAMLGTSFREPHVLPPRPHKTRAVVVVVAPVHWCLILQHSHVSAPLLHAKIWQTI